MDEVTALAVKTLQVYKCSDPESRLVSQLGGQDHARGAFRFTETAATF